MTKAYRILLFFAAALLLVGATASAGSSSMTSAARDTVRTDVAEPPLQSIVDEVIWVVGDEPILKSDVEALRAQMEYEGMRFNGDPDFILPEQIAVQKLFLHQAAIDSIEVTESEISSQIEAQINAWVGAIGSREKLEEYRGMTISQLRSQMHDEFKNQQLVQEMKRKLVADVSVTPSEVRAYFADLPADSLPYVETEVEVEIITRQPKVEQEEINRIKNLLREYTDRVMNEGANFSTLARLYSEEPAASRTGGELGYMGRGMLDPAFAQVAFNLTDPKKISKIVESEFGYHIIQLIDRRGDKVNCRHILLQPRVTQEALDEEVRRLDSLAVEIREGKPTAATLISLGIPSVVAPSIASEALSFEDAAPLISSDKDTRSNHGLMVNATSMARTSRFKMQDLPPEIATQVATMEVGEISPAFVMVTSKAQKQVAIVKLKSRIEGHRATISEDFQVLKEIVLNNEREKIINNWVKDKIKKTHVRMKPRYRNYKYQYEGWVK